MTKHQEIALANPCFLAGETAHPRFTHYAEPPMSLVLTVNAGYE